MTEPLEIQNNIGLPERWCAVLEVPGKWSDAYGAPTIALDVCESEDWVSVGGVSVATIRLRRHEVEQLIDHLTELLDGGPA